MLVDFYRKYKYNSWADRIGPDLPFTHWRLYFKDTMKRLCKRKFNHFGEGAEIRPGAYVICCSKIAIGKRVIIRPQCMLFAEAIDIEGVSISIEDDVMLGSGVHIYINNHRFDNPDIPFIDQGYHPSQPVKIEYGSWIGANVIILPGVTIGRNSVVGAGAVVTKSIPPHCLAVGNPARVIKELI